MEIIDKETFEILRIIKELARRKNLNSQVKITIVDAEKYIQENKDV